MARFGGVVELDRGERGGEADVGDGIPSVVSPLDWFDGLRDGGIVGFSSSSVSVRAVSSSLSVLPNSSFWYI